MRPVVWESEFQTNLTGEAWGVGERGDDEQDNTPMSMLIILQKANLINLFQINLLNHKTIGCGRLQLSALRIFTDVAIDISEINRGAAVIPGDGALPSD